VSEATPVISADAQTEKSKLRKSDRTRIKIIDAFERLLLTRGIEAANVTAVAEEAGIAKPLIYRYFGGFQGLVQACAERHHLWTSDQKFADQINSPDRETRLSGLKQIMVHGATNLRSRPVALKILAYHLSGNSEVTQALSKVKRKLGARALPRSEDDPRFRDPELMTVRMVMYAATMYMALRAGSDPDFNGIQLDTKAGWAKAMGMCEQIFEAAARSAIKAKKTKKTK
jgi:AcrR family transcriptional regulator